MLSLARFYHGLSAKDARLSWKLLIPVGDDRRALTLLVMKQPDLGTAILIAATGLAVMFVAGLTWRILALGVLGAIFAVPAAITFLLHGYQKERLTTFLNPGDRSPPAPATTSCRPRRRWARAGSWARASASAPRAT